MGCGQMSNKSEKQERRALSIKEAAETCGFTLDASRCLTRAPLLLTLAL